MMHGQKNIKLWKQRVQAVKLTTSPPTSTDVKNE